MFAGLGGRCSYRVPPCGPLLIAWVRKKPASTLSVRGPPRSTCDCVLRGLSLASINASLQIIPQAIDQLKSLTVASKPGDLEIVIPHLSHPATFSKNCTWMGATESHRITQYSHLRSSMETSLCCANFACSAFALDYLGEIW